MIKLQYFYYLLMFACFVNSLFYLNIKRIKILALLLLISIITETIVEVYMSKGLNYYKFYHIFNILEYSLITLSLIEGINLKPVKKLMLYSIPVFINGALLISLTVQGWEQMPSMSNSIEGLLIITWCIIALWCIEPNDDRSIFRQPSFWFIMAFFIYFICTLPFNGIFNYLITVKAHYNKTKALFSLINSVSNYLLYIFLLIGFSLYRWKKSTPQ
ncbi:hypothetical protein SAMN05421820_104333 [Pedobacter steynii]|uniref:Uncharacterized protein n=1 Tax=Pedobacter steynii TaxID=430522 RepID=A0A1G9UZC0_9SPHI|nr:hypothetical protein [Pedobacter steynii]NQX40928.1 hypothetical protein [Pedobacter steynii]SDM65213.1 hypothetical protein SAMN05421820_104333 [Pedobacter steynii]